MSNASNIPNNPIIDKYTCPTGVDINSECPDGMDPSHSLNKMEMINQNPVNVDTNQNVITDATTKYIGQENQLQNQNSDKLTFNNVLECYTIGGILLNKGISVWSYSQKSKDNRQFLQDLSKAKKILQSDTTQLDTKNVQLGRNARLFQQALKHKEETKPKRADNI